MAFTRITDPTNNIANLANQPVEPPATLKQKFDQIGEDLKDYINNVFLPELESTTNGDSGADNVGATPIPGGTANTVQGIMKEINLKTEALLPFPDGSVTNNKLATDVKVGSLSTLDALLTGFKTSVTVAMNKVVSWIGDITLLSTTDKTSTVNAINELVSTKLNSTSYTANDVLTKLLTVDGSGSGLDADLWRGWEIYESISQLGLDYLTCTPQQVADAMPVKSKLKSYFNTGNPNFLPGVASVLTAEKLSFNETEFTITAIYTTGEHIVKTARYFNNGAGTTQWTGWKSVVLDSTTVTTITTGFASGWSGTITAIKNHNNLCQVNIAFEKSTDILSSDCYTFIYTLGNVGIRPTIIITQAVELITVAGVPIVGNNTNMAIYTDGNIQLLVKNSTPNARRIEATFMYYTA